jgi:hypothetical protein
MKVSFTLIPSLSQEKVSFQEGQQQFTTRILSLEVQIEEA